jgi:hypothetical protein
MLDFRLFYCRQWSWVMLGIFVIVVSGCSSTTLTRKQRDAMEKHLDFVADAIHVSAVKIQKPLTEYYKKHGTWPTQAEDQKTLFSSIDNILVDHDINGTKLLPVDANEVLVEYYFARQPSRRFPALLESWLIVFSNKSNQQLEVVAIYPSWSDPEKLSRELPMDTQKIVALQNSFREKLHKKLANYKLSLNEHMNEPI